jgi:hypothetical protein
MRKIVTIFLVLMIIIGMSGISVAKNDDKDNNHNDGNAGRGNDNKDHDDDDSDDGDSGDDDDTNNNGISSSSHSNSVPSGGAFSFGTSDCNRMFILYEQLPDLRSERRMESLAWQRYKMTPDIICPECLREFQITELIS